MLLARDENNPKRFYSLSSQIMADRNDYCEILKTTQTGAGDITDWLKWFLECMNRAILNSNTLLEKIMIKARFWKEFAQTRLHERQTKVINRLLDAGADGFKGGLKNKKCIKTWASRCMAWASRCMAGRPAVWLKWVVVF